jgi:hypothetical protein
LNRVIGKHGTVGRTLSNVGNALKITTFETTRDVIKDIMNAKNINILVGEN